MEEMLGPILGIVTAFWLSEARQAQDTVLALQPPAAKCTIARDPWKPAPYCLGFIGPGWLTRNPLPIYPPLLRESGVEFMADLSLHVDSLGTVTQFEYRDTLASGQQSLRPHFRLALANSLGTWRFVPATKNGRPVPTAIRVVVLWSLESCAAAPESSSQVQSTAHVGPAALVVEVAACTPPPSPPTVVH